MSVRPRGRTVTPANGISLPSRVGERLGWQDEAACREPDVDARWWDPEDPATSRSRAEKAARTCRTACPVREQCEAWARENRESAMIWGGYYFGSWASSESVGKVPYAYGTVGRHPRYRRKAYLDKTPPQTEQRDTPRV